MIIVVGNKAFLEDPPPVLREELAERLTFPNPKWVENERLGYWNGQTSRLLRFYDMDDAGRLVIPRGFMRQLLFLCKRHGIQFQIRDRRRSLPDVALSFRGQLRPFQQKAVEALLQRDFGVLDAPTGSGKTVIALFMVAERKQPALVVVHTKELLNQWIDRIEAFLGIPGDQVGVVGDGKQIIGEKVTVALVQSLYKCAREVAPYIGQLITDECHRTPARTFTDALTAFGSHYMLGLSATPWRRDGLSRLIFWHVGDIAHEIKKEDLIKTGDILPAEVITRETDFSTFFDPSEEYSRMLSELTQDAKRNALIAADVAREAQNGSGICLVLSDRKRHCTTLCDLLSEKGVVSEVLTGDLSNGERQDIVDRLNRGKIKVLVATGQLIGEGFDCRQLSTLFLATPIKFDGRTLQYLGRVLRPAPGKDKAKIFDYVDANIGVLVAAAKARKRVYARAG